MDRVRLVQAATLMIGLILTIGCESRDQRLADFAGQALDQQARPLLERLTSFHQRRR